jgi:D-glycerate 3-kinase
MCKLAVMASALADMIWPQIAERLGPAGLGRAPLCVGINGPQGSGKSTLVAALAARAAGAGVAAATLSLDDLYWPRDVRRALARNVHPLLGTRGVPGTHDVGLGLDVLAALKAGGPAALPRFAKAADDRAVPQPAPAGTRLILFEGWCLGAPPQPGAALAEPINALEARDDADGQWRRHVNAALAGDYQALWQTVDLLIALGAPDWPTVCGWRAEAEAAQIAATGQGMNTDELARFMAHYERLTRWQMQVMPGLADIGIALDAARQPL